MDELLGYSVAEERIRLVTAWYTARIHERIQSSVSQPVVMDRLLASRQKCIDDQCALVEASDVEIDRMARQYAMLYRMLTK